jgi:hypothetical protein
MHCLACKSDRLISCDTKISDFLAERIFNVKDDMILPVKLYHCMECGFAFYDKRLSEAEEGKLYSGYRSDEYQKMRQRHDIWYTPAINQALCKDEKGLNVHRALIERICKENIPCKIHRALDYGGDMGQKYPSGLSIDEKYVYDVSGAETVEGVVSLSTFNLAKAMEYDLIMCNQVLEHIGELDYFIGLIKSLGNENTWFYFDVPFDSPYIKSSLGNFQYLVNPYFRLSTMIRHFSRIKKQGYFAPMTEHINFFTPNSMKRFCERNKFYVVDCQVSSTFYVLGKSKVISLVCKLV